MIIPAMIYDNMDLLKKQIYKENKKNLVYTVL